MLLLAAVLSIVLTLAAAGDLIFAQRNEAGGKAMARVSLLLLLVAYGVVIAGFGIAVGNRHPAGTLWVAVAAASAGFITALFARGWFRWLAAGAAILLVVWVLPILKFVASGQGAR